MIRMGMRMEAVARTSEMLRSIPTYPPNRYEQSARLYQLFELMFMA